MLRDPQGVPHILANEDTQVAAIVIGVAAHVSIAAVTLIITYWRGVSYAIMHGIDVHGATVAGAKKDCDNPCAGKARDMPQDILGPVVLVMARIVVHRFKGLVPHGGLPHNDAAVRVLCEGANVAEVTCKIGEGMVIAIPPRSPSGLRGVTIGHIVGEQIPT